MVIDLQFFASTGMEIAEILLLCGFFMINIVEEVTHKVVDKLHLYHGPQFVDVHSILICSSENIEYD